MNISRRSAITFLLVDFLAFTLWGCGRIDASPARLPETTGYETVSPAIITDGGIAALSPSPETPPPTQSETPLPAGVAQLPPGCRDALSITREDYGKTLCAGGVVVRISQERGTYFVYFSDQRDKLYFKGTDWMDRIGLRKGECAYGEGTLSRDIVAAVMPITPFTLKRCPVTPPPSAPARPANLPGNCAYALEITRDDVGLKKCVGGSVALSEWEGNTYKIYFYSDKSFGLHLVSTRWTGRGVNSGDCVYVTEETIRLEEKTNTPILNVVPGNVTFCPA
jgi:hypothetical protein